MAQGSLQANGSISIPELNFHAVDASRWPDMEALFGVKGACGGCWCMVRRLPRAQFESQKGEMNKQAMRALVLSGPPPGMLAYSGRTPIGWCAFGPRSNYLGFLKSRILKPIDDLDVWAVVCFFIQKPYRRKGLTIAFLKEVMAYAKRQGATILEAYPLDPKDKASPDVFAWPGLYSAYRAVGFAEVARRSSIRPIVRYSLTGLKV